MWYEFLLWVLGRQDEAQEQMTLAAMLDPLSRIVQSNLRGLLTVMGKAQEAIEQFNQTLEEYPSFGRLHEDLGWACYSVSRPGEAVEEIRQALALTNNDPGVKSSLACVLALAGKRDEASKLLDELKETSRLVIVSKVQLAQILFALGKNDDAFRLLG